MSLPEDRAEADVEPAGERSKSGAPALREVQAELEKLGFRPSRRRGQNFLLDPSAAQAIVRDAGVTRGARVLEVGPGCGALTAPLVEAGAEVLAVEIDERLLALARRRVEAPAAEPERVRWIHADVLAGKHRLDAGLEHALASFAPWHLVSNLPYSISAPLMALLAAREEPPLSMTVLVQREVGDRLCAAPGTRDHGLLTLAVGLAYDVRRLREFPPRAFWPRPKIRSSLLRLDLRADRRPAVDRARFLDLARGLLQRRRQGLARVLAEHMKDREAAEGLLAALGIDPRQRAEELSRPTFQALSDAYSAWEAASRAASGLDSGPSER
jgi:16S rRNA (adenine1518-N6/adenine1519-N6)-dimethyltransferase